LSAIKKIAIVTGSRAEYGLLYHLLKEIQSDSDLQLQLIVTAMHLSPEFGLTYQFIEQDGFVIDAKVEMLLSSDTSVGITKSVGLGVIGFADCFDRLKPDLTVLLGDRFEILAAAQAALFLKIPIAHIHGGELSFGALDENVRHCITKMSHLHFTAAEPYRKRVIQMGEHPSTVFNVGALGIERIRKITLINQSDLEKILDFQFKKLIFLVTYHPATLELNDIESELHHLFNALDTFSEAQIIITKSNADEAGRFVNQRIDDYVVYRKERVKAFVTLGDIVFQSVMSLADVMIGNSSSGIIEAPAIPIPTVNIGCRQDGRLRADSVIDCGHNEFEIQAAIRKSLSPEFKAIVKKTISPYYCCNTAMVMKSIIKNTDLKKLTKKIFYDIEAHGSEESTHLYHR